MTIRRCQHRPGVLFKTIFFPDFLLQTGADLLHSRYAELRREALTDEALIAHADALFDHLTDCGARARDAKRWKKTGVAEDNSFLQAFIPERMAFLDEEFGFEG